MEISYKHSKHSIKNIPIPEGKKKVKITNKLLQAPPFLCKKFPWWLVINLQSNQIGSNHHVIHGFNQLNHEKTPPHPMKNCTSGYFKVSLIMDYHPQRTSVIFHSQEFHQSTRIDIWNDCGVKSPYFSHGYVSLHQWNLPIFSWLIGSKPFKY